MIAESNSGFPSVSQGLQMYQMTEDVVSSSLKASSGSETHSNSLLYSLSLLKDRVHQVQSLVTILISTDQNQQFESKSIAIANMGTTIQEIIVTASSMMFTCQQMASGSNTDSGNTTNHELHQIQIPGKVDEETVLSTQQSFGADRLGTTNIGQERTQSFYCGETFDWYGDGSYNTYNTNDSNQGTQVNIVERRGNHRSGNENFSERTRAKSPSNYDIIELDAADLLAKYTHYCQVCGKGFKRDANLRMHMRAHGDEYKTSAALSNPMKKHENGIGETDRPDSINLPRKYSCPQEGCRWNRKHAKFQPLKSMICVKNHYKRSHCPKMYVCKRCNRKQFSVLSDLRTHEKHCGDLKWLCSCGTTFSRKDKLMGHVALFVGHTPAVNSMPKLAKVENHGMQQAQIEDT